MKYFSFPENHYIEYILKSFNLIIYPYSEANWPRTFKIINNAAFYIKKRKIDRMKDSQREKSKDNKERAIFYGVKE